MLPHHSQFEKSDYAQFLSGTMLMDALEKTNSVYLRKEFKRNSFSFLEDLVSTILSSLCARSPIGRGLSAFLPDIVIGGDEHSAISLFTELVNAMGRMRWPRIAEKEGCKAEFQSLVRDLRDEEYGPTVRRREIGNVITFYVSMASFRCRRNLYKVGIFQRFLVLFEVSFRSHCYVLF